MCPRHSDLFVVQAHPLEDLLLEGRTIQQRIPKQNPDISEKNLSRSFANLMFEGNTKAAICLLTEDSKGGVLRTTLGRTRQ